MGRVQVVDQGTDPLESRDRFAELAAGFGDRLRYVRQPNLGGAGGFTRGLFDATAGPADEHADVLLMDDDVLLEPEILIRLTAFAACTTHPTIVGGQMLNLLHPAHLHISAEKADPELLQVGMPVPGALREAYLLGLDERQLPINQERRVDTEYNGWWSCLIPAAIVRAIGYPLPLFFQWDDIEFGYRARAHGYPTVALPGAGVWHADFGWKDWDEWHRYFNMRNGLITAALHTDFSVRPDHLPPRPAARAVPGGHALRAGRHPAGRPWRTSWTARRPSTTGRPRPRRRSAGSGPTTRRRSCTRCRSCESTTSVSCTVVRAANAARQRAADLGQAGRLPARRPGRAPHRLRAGRGRALVARVHVRAGPWSPTCPSRATGCAPGTGRWRWR